MDFRDRSPDADPDAGGTTDAFPDPAEADPIDIERYNQAFLAANPDVAVDARSTDESATMDTPFAKQEGFGPDAEPAFKSKFPWLYDPAKGRRWDFDPVELRVLAQENAWVQMMVQSITKEIAETSWTITTTDDARETDKRLSQTPGERDPIEKDLPDDTAEAIYEDLRRPVPHLDWSDAVEMWLRDYLEVGSMVAAKVFDERYYDDEDELAVDADAIDPLALQPTAPEVWTKDYSDQSGIPQGYWQFARRSTPGGAHHTSRGVGDPTHFGIDEVLWSDNAPATNRGYGDPPTLFVSEFLQSVGLAVDQEQNYLSRGSIPSGAWVFEEWDREEVLEWKANNAENIKGKPHKSLMFAGRGGDVSFEPMSMNFQELEFTERMQWYARVIAAAFQVPTAVVGVEPENINYNCYTEDTEVLTEDGWKYYDEVGDSDEIAVYDPDDHTLEYEIPESRVDYEVDGEEIAHVGNTRTDFAVTQDHKILHTNRKNPDGWRLTPYRDIEYQNLKFRTAPDKLDDADAIGEFTVPGVYSRTRTEPREDITVDGEDFLEFLGYFIAEGGFDSRENRYGVQFCQTDEIGERVQTLLDRMGFTYNAYEKDADKDEWSDAVTVKCYDKRLYTYLEENCGVGSGEMRIPREFLDAPRDDLRVLFDALMDGDAHDKSDASTVYTTTSEQLADDVQELAFKLGYSASVAESPRHGDGHADAYNVNILDDGREVEFRRYSDSVTEETVDYSGTVWCFETSTGVFVTRRNGKVAIQGNTFQGERENFETNTLGPYLQDFERWLNAGYVETHYDGYRFEFTPGFSETTRQMRSERIRAEFDANLRPRSDAMRELGIEEPDDAEDGFKDDVVEGSPEGDAGDALGDLVASRIDKADERNEREADADTDETADETNAQERPAAPDPTAVGNTAEFTGSHSAAPVTADAVAKDEPLRETDDWSMFDVQPGEVDALASDLAGDFEDLFADVLEDDEIREAIEQVAGEETDKSVTAIGRRLKELLADHDLVDTIQTRLEEASVEEALESIRAASERVDGDVDVDEQAIREQLRDRTQRFADDIANEMSEDIRETVGDGFAEGKNSREIAADIAEQGDFEEGWGGAERIARQELHVASGKAREAVAEDLGKVEVWETAGDNRVRDAHAEMQGRWKRPGEEFVVEYERGTKRETVPGDSENGIGCRCTTLLVDREDVDEADHAGSDGL